MKTNRFFYMLLTMVIFLCTFAVPTMADDSSKAFSSATQSSTTLPTRPARYPEEGELYGYGNNGIAELQYNARYLFEQRKFPRTVFQYEKETIEYINTSNISKMKANI